MSFVSTTSELGLKIVQDESSDAKVGFLLKMLEMLEIMLDINYANSYSNMLREYKLFCFEFIN
jgi:hypothetical protein